MCAQMFKATVLTGAVLDTAKVDQMERVGQKLGEKMLQGWALIELHCPNPECTVSSPALCATAQLALLLLVSAAARQARQHAVRVLQRHSRQRRRFVADKLNLAHAF